jgi:hypothetical protein
MDTKTKLQEWQECRATWRKVERSLDRLEAALTGKPKAELPLDIFGNIFGKKK